VDTRNASDLCFRQAWRNGRARSKPRPSLTVQNYPRLSFHGINPFPRPSDPRQLRVLQHQTTLTSPPGLAASLKPLSSSFWVPSTFKYKASHLHSVRAGSNCSPWLSALCKCLAPPMDSRSWENLGGSLSASPTSGRVVSVPQKDPIQGEVPGSNLLRADCSDWSFHEQLSWFVDLGVGGVHPVSNL
jgi:hypothetical protein